MLSFVLSVMLFFLPVIPEKQVHVLWKVEPDFKDFLEVSTDTIHWKLIPGPYPVEGGEYKVSVYEKDSPVRLFRVWRIDKPDGK